MCQNVGGPCWDRGNTPRGLWTQSCGPCWNAVFRGKASACQKAHGVCGLQNHLIHPRECLSQPTVSLAPLGTTSMCSETQGPNVGWRNNAWLSVARDGGGAFGSRSPSPFLRSTGLPPAPFQIPHGPACDLDGVLMCDEDKGHKAANTQATHTTGRVGRHVPPNCPAKGGVNLHLTVCDGTPPPNSCQLLT